MYYPCKRYLLRNERMPVHGFFYEKLSINLQLKAQLLQSVAEEYSRRYRPAWIQWPFLFFSLRRMVFSPKPKKLPVVHEDKEHQIRSAKVKVQTKPNLKIILT